MSKQSGNSAIISELQRLLEVLGYKAEFKEVGRTSPVGNNIYINGSFVGNIHFQDSRPKSLPSKLVLSPDIFLGRLNHFKTRKYGEPFDLNRVVRSILDWNQARVDEQALAKANRDQEKKVRGVIQSTGIGEHLDAEPMPLQGDFIKIRNWKGSKHSTRSILEPVFSGMEERAKVFLDSMTLSPKTVLKIIQALTDDELGEVRFSTHITLEEAESIGKGLKADKP
jgi:hypothetical protein